MDIVIITLLVIYPLFCLFFIAALKLISYTETKQENKDATKLYNNRGKQS